MPMNRVQLQKGLSMPQFMSRYRTEDQCEQALISVRWPSGFVCPNCGVLQSRTSFRREGRLYWQCAGCQHQCMKIAQNVHQFHETTRVFTSIDEAKKKESKPSEPPRPPAEGVA